MNSQPTQSKEDRRRAEVDRHNQALADIEENRAEDLNQAYANYQSATAAEYDRHNQALAEIDAPPAPEPAATWHKYGEMEVDKNFQPPATAENQPGQGDDAPAPAAGIPAAAETEAPADPGAMAPAAADPVRDEYIETVYLINAQATQEAAFTVELEGIAVNYHRSPGELKVIGDGLEALRELLDIKRNRLLEIAEAQYNQDKIEGGDHEVDQSI